MVGYGPGQQAPPPYPVQGQPGQHQPSPPIFVAPPPKPQRLLHSEAYLKYIEGLSADSSTISKWDQSLKGKIDLCIQFDKTEVLLSAKVTLCVSSKYYKYRVLCTSFMVTVFTAAAHRRLFFKGLKRPRHC